MTYTIQLIELHLRNEKIFRKKAKEVLAQEELPSNSIVRKIAANMLNLCNQSIPELKSTLNFLVMGKAQWYRKRVRPHNN